MTALHPTEGGEVGTEAVQGSESGDEPLISPEMLKSLGLDFTEPTTPPPSTPPGTEPPPPATEPDEELREAARAAGLEEGYARARRELEETQAAAQEELRRSGEYQDFQKRYRDRISSFDSQDLAQKFLAASTVTETLEVLKEVKEEFNSHHADGLKLYKDEAIATVAADYTGQLFDSIGTALGEETKASLVQAHEARKPNERSWKVFVQDLVDAARKDTLTQTKAVEVAQAAVAKVARDEAWLRARLSQITAPGSTSLRQPSTPTDDQSVINRAARGEAVDMKQLNEALARLEGPLVG